MKTSKDYPYIVNPPPKYIYILKLSFYFCMAKLVHFNTLY